MLELARWVIYLYGTDNTFATMGKRFFERKAGSVTMAKSQGARGAMEPLEGELAMLVRGLEAVQRKRAYPLERAHYLLIRLIGEEGPRSVGEIARRLLLDDSTVTRQVAAMAAAGLVRKKANPADARSALVHATEAGIAKAEAMRRQRFERLETLFHGWSEEERAECARVIGRLNASLREVTDQPAAEAGKTPA